MVLFADYITKKDKHLNWSYMLQAVAGDLDAISGEKGPLHGIPISLKESFYLAGLESTGGFGQYVGDTQSEDAVIVKVGSHYWLLTTG